MNEEVKNLFLAGTMVSLRGARKLSSYLVRAKLYPFHRKIGSKKCAKNCCEVCDYVTDADTFTSTMTGESFKINHRLNCDDMYHISPNMQAMSEAIYWGNYG